MYIPNSNLPNQSFCDVAPKILHQHLYTQLLYDGTGLSIARLFIDVTSWYYNTEPIDSDLKVHSGLTVLYELWV